MTEVKTFLAVMLVQKPEQLFYRGHGNKFSDDPCKAARYTEDTIAKAVAKVEKELPNNLVRPVIVSIQIENYQIEENVETESRIDPNGGGSIPAIPTAGSNEATGDDETGQSHGGNDAVPEGDESESSSELRTGEE